MPPSVTLVYACVCVTSAAWHHLLAADRRQGRRQRLRREDALARLLHGRRVLRASRLLLLADAPLLRLRRLGLLHSLLHRLLRGLLRSLLGSHRLQSHQDKFPEA